MHTSAHDFPFRTTATPFTKSGSAPEIIGEVLGLRELGTASMEGGVPTVPVLSSREEHLAGKLREPGIASTRPTREAAYDFGMRLARTHAFCPSGERAFGSGPANPHGDTYRLGSWDLPLASQGDNLDFGQFYARLRIGPYLAPAVDNGCLSVQEAQRVEQLCERIVDGDFTSPQPALVRTQAALLHGDLWSGNVMWAEKVDGSGNGAPVPCGVLIDPVVHGGHAETDLATLTVFSTPYIDEIYAGYNAVSPLAEGWQRRIGFHQLHCLAIHCAMFGGSYGRQFMQKVDHYLQY